jgi:hypothetical protein
LIADLIQLDALFYEKLYREFPGILSILELLIIKKHKAFDS